MVDGTTVEMGPPRIAATVPAGGGGRCWSWFQPSPSSEQHHDLLGVPRPPSGRHCIPGAAVGRGAAAPARCCRCRRRRSRVGGATQVPEPCPPASLPATGARSAMRSAAPRAGSRAGAPRGAAGGVGSVGTMAAMRVSTRGDYASRALLSLAMHSGDGAHPGPRHRRPHRPPPALPRADPARAEGRRPGEVQAPASAAGTSWPAEPGDITVGAIVGAGRRPDRPRRLRGAPHRRRLRPRGPVRAAGHLGPRRGARRRTCSTATRSPTWRAMARGAGSGRLPPGSAPEVAPHLGHSGAGGSSWPSAATRTGGRSGT